MRCKLYGTATLHGEFYERSGNQQETLVPIYLIPQQCVVRRPSKSGVTAILGVPRFVVAGAEATSYYDTLQQKFDIWLLSVWASFLMERRGIATELKSHTSLLTKRITCHVYVPTDNYKGTAVNSPNLQSDLHH
jgi:hypothetical protein